MTSVKHLEKIAIIGATGHIGEVFLNALLKTGKHTITALTRAETKGTFPDAVKRVQVDFAKEETLVAALEGQQFVIITLAVMAPPDIHSRIVSAADKAGVPYVMPNFYGADIRSPKFGEGNFGALLKKQLAEMDQADISYISLACGVWYEWSLALGEPWFGFAIAARKATFFDDGQTAVRVSTWTQCGRAVAALLSLPETGASPCVADWKNEPLYLTSFEVSQRAMLDSLHRVLGTTDADWEIRHEDTAQRIRDGAAEMAKGNRTGVAKSMYGKLFQDTREGLLKISKEPANKALGLPEESLDEATKAAVDMVARGWTPSKR
ncbi:hypothetical protein F4778DRAFT_799959 [Xylariomycetidae sp. FL2044]|nr:hypothetical protein F4778DRAFT_799959 [Xylariomycetidae sp. FL2044]